MHRTFEDKVFVYILKYVLTVVRGLIRPFLRTASIHGLGTNQTTWMAAITEEWFVLIFLINFCYSCFWILILFPDFCACFFPKKGTLYTRM